MQSLPDFDADGLLPQGDYYLTIEQLKQSKLVLGPGDPNACLTWDASWRERLVGNREILVRPLHPRLLRGYLEDLAGQNSDMREAVPVSCLCGKADRGSPSAEPRLPHAQPCALPR